MQQSGFTHDSTATIRKLRTDFRAVKRKLEQIGEIIITDHGQPAYLLKPLPRRTAGTKRPMDHYARLLKRQPKAVSAEESRRFWEEERRDR